LCRLKFAVNQLFVYSVEWCCLPGKTESTKLMIQHIAQLCRHEDQNDLHDRIVKVKWLQPYHSVICYLHQSIGERNRNYEMHWLLMALWFYYYWCVLKYYTLPILLYCYRSIHYWKHLAMHRQLWTITAVVLENILNLCLIAEDHSREVSSTTSLILQLIAGQWTA